VARDFPGIAARVGKVKGSVLILGPPGWGKTTLLRDLIRQISESETVSVVDERGELFPEGFEKGKRTDVLTGCPKEKGIFMLLRTMGPSSIAVDEITDERDATAILHAANCGVRLLASAHADSLQSFRNRAVYSALMENHVFDIILVLKNDYSYTLERVKEWAINGSVRY
jgi:stage III sporulation protein AA